MNLDRSRSLLVLLGVTALAACSDPGSGTGDLDIGTDGVTTDVAADGADGNTDTATPDTAGDAADVAPDVDEDASDAASDVTDGSGEEGGEIGDPCVEDADCESLLCVDVAPGEGGEICVSQCRTDEDCPDGSECVLIGSGADGESVCVPLDLCVDLDGDLHGVGPGCRGPDCNDDTVVIHFGAPELCDLEDNDCDGSTDEGVEGTGVACDTGALGACSAGRVACTDGITGCEALAVPTGELCNNVDDDCDGEIDVDASDAPLWYADVDEDRYGDDEDTVASCSAVAGRVNAGGDCNDALRSINPAQSEICDGVDNDCDDLVDEEGAVGTVTRYLDFDGDGFGDPAGAMATCGDVDGYVANDDDCDDENGDINPDAVDICDGVDNDCNGEVDAGRPDDEGFWYLDFDGDTWGDTSTAIFDCEELPGHVRRGGDCADDVFAVNPDATEVCDGVDNNCAGGVDESTAADAGSWYIDGDGDGYGTGAVVRACGRPDGYVGNASDCNDGNDQVRPGATEICNGIDDNCAGGVDEGTSTDAATWYRDIDGDSYGDPGLTTRACSRPAGYVANSSDCNDSSDLIRPGATEFCNGYDDNCNTETDESTANDASTWYLDADSDTWGLATSTTRACTQPGGYVARSGDCYDDRTGAFPGATEVCNGLDDDCDPQIDEGVQSTFYRDNDGDNYGTPLLAVAACTAPTGYVANQSDCNDGESRAWTGRAEECDGVDNNCTSGVDEGVQNTYYRDVDGDTYGTAAAPTFACTLPAGYVSNAQDCNDGEPQAWTGRAELCDSIDNDCDTQIDEGAQTTYYRDVDSDTYGNPALTTFACSVPIGYVANAGDCNDSQPAAWSGRGEICDLIDNNCNSQTDEGVLNTYYRDSDSDTYGNPSVTTTGCSVPSGYVANNQDCGDNSAAIRPGATEVCDGVDNNCVSGIDEGFSSLIYYRDQDSDGYGNPAISATGCTPPSGYVANDDDCNDSSNQQAPNLPERCSTVFDDDCDGSVNESSSVDATPYYIDSDSDEYGEDSPIYFTGINRWYSCTPINDTCLFSLFGFCVERVDVSPTRNDCDDSTGRAYPGGGTDVCDGYDNDCNGSRDSGQPVNYTLYYDGDGDGCGSNTRIDVCAYPVDSPADWVTNSNDPDDDDDTDCF